MKAVLFGIIGVAAASARGRAVALSAHKARRPFSLASRVRTVAGFHP
ncbi:MAG: hypothetical protein MJZ10_08300 [Fibrobacter sp.]|nr:hypothetical protein [Fibrobacter sp.]